MGIFSDSSHAERFAQAVQIAKAVRGDGSIKGDFGASLYILTGLPSAYGRLEQHVHPGYIDFEPMFNMGLSSGETILVALAGSFYGGGSASFFDRYTPLDIVSYCDTDGVKLAAQALLLRKRRLDINTIYDD